MTLLHQGLGHKILEVSDHSYTSCTFPFILNGPKVSIFPYQEPENSSLVAKESWNFAFLPTELGNNFCGNPKIQEASRTLPLDTPGLTNLYWMTFCQHRMAKSQAAMVAQFPLKQPSVQVLA